MDWVHPQVTCDIHTREYGRFTISPLERGYGTIIGNTLRRVLLSSISGAGVTSIHLSDVYHEYSAIPHVKEDMVELMLNLKQLRIRMEAESPARLYLSIEHQGIVTAADVKCDAGVEVVNPELYLFTVDSDDAEVYIEMVVEKGIGYWPVEGRKGTPSTGEIRLGTLFSPIRKVNFDVGQISVDGSSPCDKLTLEICTDGTIGPQEALNEAVEILLRHLAIIRGEAVSVFGVEMAEAKLRRAMAIEDLGLSVRVYNCLKRVGISEAGEVLDKLEQGDDELLAIRHFGVKSLAELKEKLAAHDLLPPNS